MIQMIVRRRLEYEALLCDRIERIYESRFRWWAVRCIYGNWRGLLYRQVAAHVGSCCNYAVRHSDSVGGRGISTTYNELCRSPGTTVERIISFLGQKCSEAPDYDTLVRPRSGDIRVLSDAQVSEVRSRNAEFCRKFGV
jgi:hypothetical protein